jgi:hypothetical protein
MVIICHLLGSFARAASAQKLISPIHAQLIMMNFTLLSLFLWIEVCSVRVSFLNLWSISNTDRNSFSYTHEGSFWSEISFPIAHKIERVSTN